MSVEIHDYSSKVISETNDAIEQFLWQVGEAAETYAKRKCPVGTPESTGIKGYIGGTLKNSIDHDADSQQMILGSNVEYCPYVEIGTYKMAARPFLRTALTEHTSTYKQLFKSIVGKK